MVTAVTTTKKCKLSYGTPIATANALKRITKWSEIGTANKPKYFNLPLTWKKGARTTTMCVYSDYTADASCKFESICGLAGGDKAPVPDDAGNFDDGCEFRIVGRKIAGSSACCAPTFAVESFDSNAENRLSGDAVTQIELHGV
jgi:hypothetical protein